MTEVSKAQKADWLEPPQEQESLSRFVSTVRERLWLVVLVTLITTGIALLYVSTTAKVYEAESDLLVNPVSADNPLYTSIGLFQGSVDPSRDVETVSRLVTTREVAQRVEDELQLGISTESLLRRVTAQPIAQSNLVAITARANLPEEARDIANAFAQEFADGRTDELHDQIDATIQSLEAQIASGTAVEDGTTSPQASVAQLRLLGSSPDPTVKVGTLAATPSLPVAPRPVLSVVGGILAGLILGITAAFAAQALDPRLRREEQLRRMYRLPILARIPKEPRKRNRKPLDPQALSAHSIEAYRMLRGTLAASRHVGDGLGRALMVTGPTANEGKTTTAINLATALAAAGHRVILIEADLRKPAIGEALEVTAEHGIVSVLLESVELRNALVTDTIYGDNLGLLLADYEGGWITELFSLHSARKMIDEARALAHYVIVDSPPLTEVIDALPLAHLVDDVLIVTRLGNSRLSSIQRLGELLAENDIRPAGFAVVGVERPTKSGYYAEKSPLFQPQSLREDAKRRSSRAPAKTRS